MIQKNKDKPIICSFYALCGSLQAIHLNVKADVDRLHDVWLIGAPVPSSRIMQPKIYDPRKPQAKQGNVEKRIVFPNLLAMWIKDCLERSGKEITLDEAMVLVEPISQRWG